MSEDYSETSVVEAALDAQLRKMPSRVSCTIDFGADGKHFGLMTVPHSRNESAWGSIQIPIICARNGSGPTLLFTAGLHGDEYEGPIALMKLARDLDPGALQGRVIITPTLNLPAIRAATRLSPIDGRNMNRVFPGNRDGTVTEVIAHYVHTELLPMADAVVDIHSGGKTLDFVPSAVMHYLDDSMLMDRTLAAVKAFGAPVGLILRELDNQGMLDTAVEDMRKLFISTELGGSGTSTARSITIAERGLKNLLRHFRLVEGKVETPEAAGHPPTRMMQTPDGDCFTLVKHAGILEMTVDLGAAVEEGQLLGRIHDYEEPAQPPVPYYARKSGMLLSRHAPGLIQRGDCMAVIATDIPPSGPADLYEQG